MALRANITFQPDQNGVVLLKNWGGAIEGFFPGPLAIDGAYVQVRACKVSKIPDGTYIAEGIAVVVDENTKLEIAPVCAINGVVVCPTDNIIEKLYEAFKVLPGQLYGAEDC